MYGKVFDSMYEGTLYGHWEAIVTLQQMLVLCNMDGVVDMTPQAISARTSIPLEIITKGIVVLSEPDPYSRTPGEEGKRIALLDQLRPWGWRIVNHAKYQQIRNRIAKLEADRRRVQEKRDAEKALKIIDVAYRSKSSQPVRDVADASASASASASADATAPATTKESSRPSRVGQRRAAETSNGSELWQAYSSAYQKRYGVAPVRNKKVNAQLAQLVQRVGTEEATKVADHYVRSQRRLYVSARHCVDLLLRDAEALRTEWATGLSEPTPPGKQSALEAANQAAVERFVKGHDRG